MERRRPREHTVARLASFGEYLVALLTTFLHILPIDIMLLRQRLQPNRGMARV